jgi:formylglycine-generating enzyme required for sulfatase activity
VAHPPKVFISYSHDDEEHKERVLQLASRLRNDGVDAEMDRYEDAPAEGWPQWCERQIDRADFVLMVCTETYLRRFQGEGETGKGLGVPWEAQIVRSILYNSGSVSGKFIPVLFSDGSIQNVPVIVKNFTRHQVDAEDGYVTLYRQLTNQPAVRKPALGQLRPLPPKEPKPAAGEAARAAVGVAATPPRRVFRDIEAPWCPEMVELPLGEFTMGSNSPEYREEYPQHIVKITYPLAIGRYPVTFQDYDYFCDQMRRRGRNVERIVFDDENWGRGRRPVINVSLQDAQDYVVWLSEVTGHGYRLPLEAEWEYACRAGTTTEYSCGHTIKGHDANFACRLGKVGKTAEVGIYPPNPWGLFDMHGNVWEWTAAHSYKQGQQTSKPCSHGGGWLIRGGSWQYIDTHVRSGKRKHMIPEVITNDIGFRVARNLQHI